MYGLAVHSHTDYFASIAYPAVAELALRVNKLGKSSVTYEVAVFEKGVDQVKAVGKFTHVFVERATGRPSKSGMNETLRQGLAKLLVPSKKSKL
jgi:acyl-CoA thioester hydrolase